jgi:hypothetical protein
MDSYFPTAHPEVTDDITLKCLKRTLSEVDIEPLRDQRDQRWRGYREVRSFHFIMKGASFFRMKSNHYERIRIHSTELIWAGRLSIFLRRGSLSSLARKP